MRLDSAILDGETVVMTKNGVSDFAALVKAVHRRSEQISFVAFDLLHLDGKDLRKLPLIERREKLRGFCPTTISPSSIRTISSPTGLRCSPPPRTWGWKASSRSGPGAPYRSGPSRNWLKTKNYDEIELPILGIQREAGKPVMALLGNEDDRTNRLGGGSRQQAQP